MAFVIGLDISTTATKAVVIDEAGVVVATGTAKYGYEIRNLDGVSRIPDCGGMGPWRPSDRPWPQPRSTAARWPRSG